MYTDQSQGAFASEQKQKQETIGALFICPSFVENRRCSNGASMGKISDRSRFEVVTAGLNNVAPPRELASAGRQLWDAVMREYGVSDIGGIELLLSACESLDRESSLRAAITKDGEMLYGGRSQLPRPHPGLKIELELRAFRVKTLEKLGITNEPVKAAHRPGTFASWIGDADK